MSYAFRMKATLEDAAVDSFWALGCTGVSEDKDTITAYFNEQLELPFEGEWQEVDATGYVDAYYASLKAVELEHLVIAPTHSNVTLRAGQRVLWLDPGMAFGTGHHETTKLILASLEQLDLAGKTVLDVGSGSGILAIAADLLGAKTAFGVDIDSLTIPVAVENARLNKSRASFETGTLEDVKTRSSVLVANLFAELHIMLAERYLAALEPEGSLLVSGIMKEKSDRVVSALEALFSIQDVQHDGDWSFVKASPK